MDLSVKVTREQRCKGDEELVKYIWKMGEFQAEGTARERPTGRVRAGVLRISTELEGGVQRGQVDSQLLVSVKWKLVQCFRERHDVTELEFESLHVVMLRMS